MDTWIVLENQCVKSVYRRTLGVRKSRGMAHSNEVRTFELTAQGLQLRETSEPRRALAVGPVPVEGRSRHVAAL
jgi:circadian clock protein KaiC